MRTVTTTTNLYTFNELDEDTQAKVIDANRDILVDHEWWDCIVDSFKHEVAPRFGLECDEVYFSGFSSQGDGACFTGRFDYEKGMRGKVAALEIPELDDIADYILEIQSRNFYQVSGTIRHRGHYYHSHCTRFEIERDDCEMSSDDEYRMKDCYKWLMDWLYQTLETEYDNLTSEETIREYLEDSECEFTSCGNLHC